MSRIRMTSLVLVLFLVGSFSTDAFADVKLPAVFDNHMVLQRDVPLTVWGWADSGEEVTVTIGETAVKAVADEKGDWKVSLPAMMADGKKHTLVVQGKNTVTFEDILIGDVWIGSGQSNMEWPLTSTNGAAEAIAAADHPNIRLFHVPKKQAPTPANDVVASWKTCAPENIPNFSAVLYYFGLKLNSELDVPIGLINSSWGGSPIEPWTIVDGESGGMYNGMIAPLQPFPIRGAIWYQGETNVLNKNGLAYYDKMKDLIEGWRGAWKHDFPFYFVQIAPWAGRYEPGELPKLWEAQTASLKIPGTGMVVTTDLVDNINDIHPRNKLDVGNRLAAWALAKTYGQQNVEYSGPLFKSSTIEENRVRIRFAHVGEGLKSRDGQPLSEFQIAGSDGSFVKANAEIDGKTVLVSSDDVPNPVHVRFGWHKVANPNLANSAGLPASPFQTDNWTGGTGEAAAHVGLQRVFPKLRFQRPVFLTGAGDGSGRIFVTEQNGIVRVFTPGNSDPNELSETNVFLDISDRISRKGNEEGLIGFAFHPDFKNNGHFFVHYSSSVKDMTGIVARYKVFADDPSRADPDSEEIILEQEQPYRNHNGGSIEFGRDGFLYISFGDGGKANDPHGNGQNLGTWLGSILRIDIDDHDEGKNYSIPPDNPFLETPGALPEIWAIGLRNVWRFSFDRKTDELWAGDVGQDKFDEVSLVKKGGNYGWNRYEASSDFKKDTVMATEVHDEPVTFYGREWGLSVTGGYVYRGADFPQLEGSYFYGDYVSGNLWRITKDVDGKHVNELVRRTGRSIASFGEDDRGELYLLSFDGGIYRVVPTDKPEDSFENWPQKLSETGLYVSTKEKKVSDKLVSYSVNAPFWSDDAEKSRFILLPTGEKLQYRKTGSWRVPVGTTIVKNFKQPNRRMLETRLIKRTAEGWEAATYVWDARDQDANLYPAGQQFEIYSPDRVNRSWKIDSWHAPSASECSSCHVDAAGYVLGLTTAQLNGTFDGKDQLAEWAKQEIVDLPDDFQSETAERFCNPFDETADLEMRSRVYLDVNCAMCHRPDGPGNANIDLRFSTELSKTRMINEKPAQGDLGIPDAKIVSPGDPESSLLLHRIETLGAGRMPNIGSNSVDQRGVDLIKEWIKNR